MATSRDSRFMLAIKARQELETMINPYYNYSKFTLSEKIGFIKKAKILGKDDINIMYAVMKEGNNYAHDPDYDRDDDSFKRIIYIFNSRKDYIATVLKAHSKPKDEVIDVKPTIIGKQKNELIKVVPKPKVKQKKKILPINIKAKYFGLVRSMFMVSLAIYVTYIWFYKCIPFANEINIDSSPLIYSLKGLLIYLKNEILYFIKFYFDKNRSVTIKVCYSIMHIVISDIVFKIFKLINKNDFYVSDVCYILTFSFPFMVGVSYAVLDKLYFEGFFVYIIIGCGTLSEIVYSGLFVLIDRFIFPLVLKKLSRIVKVENYLEEN